MSIEPAGYTTAPDDLQRPCIHCGLTGYDHESEFSVMDLCACYFCANGCEYEPDDRSLAEVRADDAEERRLRRSEER